MESMRTEIVETLIPLSEVTALAVEQFGDFVKVVVDIERQVIAVGGELYADQEELLLEHGSRQENLWGVNLYPREERDAWIEFDSMINIRPSQGNRSRGVEDIEIQERIRKLIEHRITP